MKATKDSLHNLATSIAGYPLLLISSIVVTRFLGPENKGIYVFLIMMSNVILPISFLGLGNGIQYYISNKTYKVKNITFSTVVVGFFTGLLVSIFIYILWKNNLYGQTGNLAEFNVLIIFLCFIPIDGMIYVIRFLLVGDSQFKLTNNVKLVIAVISAVSLLLFIFILDNKLLAAAIAVNMVKLLYFGIISYFLIKIYRPIIKMNKVYLKDTYSYGLKSWLGNISARANDQLDQLIIGMFISPTLLGIYSVSYTVVNLLLIPSNAISPVLFNEISKVKSIEKSSKMAAQIHRSLFLSVICIIAILAVAAYWLIPLMYGAEFQGAYIPFLILLPGILLYSVSRRVLHKFLSANGFPLKTSLVQFVGAVVGLICYIILIPNFNIIGAAIGSSIGYASSTLVAYILSKRLVGRNFRFFDFKLNDVYWMVNKLQVVISGLFPLKKRYSNK